MIKLESITKNVFDSLENAQKLIWNEDPQAEHAMLIGDNIKFGMAWFHDCNNFDFKIEIPEFDLLVIGTWSQVFGISTNKGNIVYLRNLLTTLVGLVKVSQGFLIITETDVVLIHGQTLVKRQTFTPENGMILSYNLLNDNQIELILDNDKIQVFDFNINH